MEENQPEALLLGSGITLLGTLRCLSRSGIRASVVSTAPSFCGKSRWYDAAPLYDGGPLSEYLKRLDRRVVLIPCSDDWAREISGLPVELGKQFPSYLPPLTVLEMFLDKALFAEHLDREGIPHPRTMVVDRTFHLDAVGTLEGIFVKPRDSQAFHRRFGVKAFWPESKNELIEKLGVLRSEGFEVILQEYVPGPPSNHYFVDGIVGTEGQVKGTFVRNRLRMHPPRFGNSSYMVSVDPEEADGAVQMVEKLVGGGDFRGVFSAEFKKDARDGVFKILEVNARPWWFVEFAADCGMNFPVMVYRAALGLPMRAPSDYRVGKRLIHPYYDVSACMREQGSTLRGGLQLLTCLPGADFPVMRWRDPMPALADVAQLTKSFVRRKFKGGRLQ